MTALFTHCRPPRYLRGIKPGTPSRTSPARFARRLKDGPRRFSGRYKLEKLAATVHHALPSLPRGAKTKARLLAEPGLARRWIANRWILYARGDCQTAVRRLTSLDGVTSLAC